MQSFFYDDDDDDDVFVFEIYLKLKFNEQLLSYDDVGRGEQHGEAGDDGEQGVDNQAEAVNHLVLLLLLLYCCYYYHHHCSKLPVGLNRRGLVLLLHLRNH